MPSSAGPNTAGDSNLAFAYDLGDVVSSYKGEPTTNFAYLHNGRKDTSYESYMPESGTGQIAALHPGAIRVYNQAGSDISYYLNTGINVANSGVDWYNTNHAYWVYDEVLKKPVVQMIDRTGVWQAKYMGLGLNWTDLGLTNGDQYTISWLQWSSDGIKRAHAGVYWYDTTAGYSNFWDGLSDTGNSTPGVWTRVSQTFTVSSGKSLDQGLTWYMYGMYYSRAILKIADVQLEKKSHATSFSFSNTRSATQGLVSLATPSTIDLTDVSFDSAAQMTFDGTNDKIHGINSIVSYLSSSAIEFIVTPTTVNKRMTVGGYRHNDGYSQPTIGMVYIQDDNTFNAQVITATQVYRGVTSTTTIAANRTYHVVFNKDTSVGLMQLYVNGVLESSQTFDPATYGQWTTAGSYIGSNILDLGKSYNTNAGQGWSGDFLAGKIPIFKLYSRTLSSSEVAQNYLAYKTRFNLA